jgi:hypothetical protein
MLGDIVGVMAVDGVPSDGECHRQELEQGGALDRALGAVARVSDADAESGDEFGLTISLSDSTGTLAGFVGNKAGARLGFGPIDTDRSFLADALALFDDIIETFPVRGDITAD